MIIIEKPVADISDVQLLAGLGFQNCVPRGTDSLENCMYPRNGSFGLGQYNGRLILTEDHQLTDELEHVKIPGGLSNYEQVLSRLFPGSEVLSVACHSANNYAMHSLVKDGVKLRYRSVSGDEKAVEFGPPLKEEETIYARSEMISGVRMFRREEPDRPYEYTEDQLMEDFTFEVAKRHLGVRLDSDETDELNAVEMRLYRFDPQRKLIPSGVRTWEGDLGTYWMEDGVLVALLNDAGRTVTNVEQSVELVKEISGGKRVPVLMIGGDRVEATDAAVKLSNEQSPLVYCAMAWIRSGWLSRWFDNRGFKRAPDALPRRVFGTKEEALAWLRRFL